MALYFQDFQDFKILLSTVTPTGALVKTFNKSNTINIRGKLQALVLTTRLRQFSNDQSHTHKAVIVRKTIISNTRENNINL